MGTLAANTVLLIGTKLAMTDSFRMLKAKGTMFIQGLTAGEGHGLVVGIAAGNLSVSQILSAIQNNGPLSRADSLGEAVMERFVDVIGSTGQVGQADLSVTFLNEEGGPVLACKPCWTFGDEGVGWNWFVANLTGASLTTGGTLRANMKSWGVWVGA